MGRVTTRSIELCTFRPTANYAEALDRFAFHMG